MATISLYASKINNMPVLIKDVKKSVTNYKSELTNLKNQSYNVNKSICDLDGVISTISTSTQTQEDKIEALETFHNNCEKFIADMLKTDEAVADIVNQSKDDFYNKYYYLKPDSEKSGLEKFWDDCKSGCKKIGEWCKDKWSEFFNSLGKLIHYQEFRELVTLVVGAFYAIGGFCFIKTISKSGTLAAVFMEKYPWTALVLPSKMTKMIAISGWLTKKFFAITLNADMDKDGIYHIRPDCWQQYVNYSTGYDDVFRAAVNRATKGELTVDIHQSDIFWADLDGDKVKDKGEEFIIWSWKGDYTNLGAGAETGIYQVIDGEKDEFGNYIKHGEEYSYIYAGINREYSVDMTLDLYYDSNKDNKYSSDEQLYTYTADHWWINGFDPTTQNVKSNELKAVATIDFSSLDKNQGEIIYNAFKETNQNYSQWVNWDDENLSVTLNWEN